MKRVVVTRSVEDVDRLAERLTSDGHLAVKLPLLAIEPLQSSLDIGNLPGTTTAIIYTSVNAVRHGFEAISGVTRNEGLVTIAVGTKTRDALGEKGVRAESPAREDSEGILAFLESFDQSPTHVVVVKGQGGRDLIETRLARLGIHLTIIECYRRIWPEVPEANFLSAVSIESPSIIHIASGETLTRLTDLCWAHGVDALDAHTLVLPSQRVANQARELGWQSRIVADGAGDEALLKAVADLS